MRIKSTVWQVLAGGSFGVGLLYALGIEGSAQVGGTISDGQFITAMVLILLAVLFMQLGFHAQDREERAGRKGKPLSHGKAVTAPLSGEPCVERRSGCKK